jgi:hypothetical protein
MCLRTVPALSSLLFSAAVVAGCGDSGDTTADADEKPTAASSSAPPAEGEASPTCDDACRAERRAEREARIAERCAPVLSQVDLTYRITATPTTGGSTIALWVTFENGSADELNGSMGGVLKVDPHPRANQISWGGSSADEISLQPGSTTEREIWHDRRPPGWHPVGERVTSFDFYTYVYSPGPRSEACHLPATITAPPGLVADHPSGRWRQHSSI